MLSREEKISGWGRSSVVNARIYQPEYLSDCKKILSQSRDTLIARGLGRSYGDCAINRDGGTVVTTQCNRFCVFDATAQTVVCESGVTLRDIQHAFLQHGLGLVTSPGTAFVTVGGAIANDVHGKNHDRVGSFSKHVLWLELLLASGDVIRCSRFENPRIFFATIGGLGLTGIITIACLQLQNQSAVVRVTSRSFVDLSAAIAALREARDTATYHVGWLDLTKKNKTPCVISIGEPDNTKIIFKKKIPRNTPYYTSLFLNPVTVSLHNTWHYQKNNSQPFLESLQTFLYPLDSLHRWNRLYGANGFYQFQCVIPDSAADESIAEIINIVKKSDQTCYLAVIKTLGSEGEGYLSFPLRGVTIALDFPKKNNTRVLLDQLSVVCASAGGRVYLAKDACITPSLLSIMYPRLFLFRDVLREVDPKARWQSEMSKRLLIRGDDV
ncbi:MAG: hypothetical protein A3B71_02515 [Gammaproteobacteria bacterium RIFCSPHIGHO2_02_FULL_42_43]|nr:MAG: hypothetical protein A3B71_02515 [Gammaproteobacteria bacterium RIFCSPHIGHO2_02_FULL_42_43]